MHVRGVVGVVMVIACALVTGCASESGMAVPRDWSASPVYAGLRSIPAGSDTKFEIGLVSAVRLNALNSADEKPLSTEPAGGRRPQSEFAWTRYAIAGSVCGLVDSQYSAVNYRTGPPGDMLSVYSGGAEISNAIGVCQGDIDLKALKGDSKQIGGIDGVDQQGIWYGRSSDLTYQIGDKIPEALGRAVVTGGHGAGTLADDPDVKAVLDANPRAAAVEMGTIFVGFGSIGGVGAKNRKLLNDAAAAQKITAPQPVFGGYGWASDDGLTGTGTFVTTYRSEQDAATTASLLTAVWAKASDTPFGEAATTATGSTVITRVPKVKVTDFNLRNLAVASYPGFNGKR